MKAIAAFCLLLAACFAAPQPLSSFAVAARSGDVGAIRELRVRGDDPNAPSGGNGWTPLLHAIHRNQLASVQALLDAGADPNRAAANGMTPLMMAAGYGYAGIVRDLLARGADVRLTDGRDDRAIDYAMAGMTDVDQFTFFRCQDDVVRALALAGAKVATPSARRWARMKRCETAELFR